MAENEKLKGGDDVIVNSGDEPEQEEEEDYKGGQPIVNPEGNEVEGEPGNEEMDEFDDDDEHF